MSAIIFVLTLFGPTVFVLASVDEPQPEYVGYVKDTVPNEELATPADNVWINSGQFEGDIMIYKNKNEFDEEAVMLFKNGMMNSTNKWPKGIVPYRFMRKAFSSSDAKVIEESMSTISENSCIRFRKYERLDPSYIVFRSNEPGCWSLIGSKSGGQVVNLNRPTCIDKTIIMHELLHALGFLHQQNIHNRDDFVKIRLRNVIKEERSKFKKYASLSETDLDTEYDYNSIMHYPRNAFSKNGKPTITSLQPGVKIVPGKTLSTIDILKLERMYKEECESREN